MKNKTKENQAVMYCRVSTKEQAEEGYSLAAQSELLKSYASAKDIKIVKEFSVPESASGKQARKVFQQMIEYAEKNNIGNILCEKIDRMTRNQKEAITASEWLDGDESRRVHFVKENFIAHKNTKAHENLVWDMKIAIARFYSNNLSEEVRKGQAQKIKEGWLPSRPPLGYKTVGEKGHKIHKLDEEKAPYVRKMFELYASGQHSLKSLVEIMFKEGLRNEAGRKVLKSRMAELLSDPFYYGAMKWKGQIYAGKHEALISKELYDSVQLLMHSKTTPKYRKHFSLFKGMIEHSACGGVLTAEIQKGHRYYHCSRHNGCTGHKYAREDRLEAQIMEVFDWFDAGMDPEEVELVRQMLKEDHAEEVAYVENAAQSLDRQYAILQQRKDRCYMDKLDGKIGEDKYADLIRQWDEKQNEILDQKSRLKLNNTNYLLLGGSFLDLAKRAKDIYLGLNDDIMAKREFLSLIFSNLAFDGENLSKTYRKPIERIRDRVIAAKSETGNFEPHKTRSNKRQNGSLSAVSSSLLRGQDSNLEPSP